MADGDFRAIQNSVLDREHVHWRSKAIAIIVSIGAVLTLMYAPYSATISWLYSPAEPFIEPGDAAVPPGQPDPADPSSTQPFPVLVVKSEMKTLHYCGFNPDLNETFPHIPPPPSSDFTLIQVQNFIRHGARFLNNDRQCWPGQDGITYNCSLTDISIAGTNLSDHAIQHPKRIYRHQYIKDRDAFRGNCRLGQLTSFGYRQHVALGSIFKQAYIPTLLDANLDPKQVYFRSHDMPRTLMSAQSFIKGMFPDKVTSEFTSLVDLWTMDVDDEDEVINAHDCPGVAEQRKEALSSPAYIQHEATFGQRLNEKLSEITGIPVDGLGTNKFDCLFVSLCAGDPVPEGVDYPLMQDLDEEARFRLYHLIQYPNRIEGSKLSIGPLLREIVFGMERAVSDDPKSHRFYLYSGHDSGPIMLLLSAFSIEDEHWAPFASYIALELYRHVNGQHFVRVIYNGVVRPLPTSGADDLIAFDQFRAMLLPMIPTSQECPDVYQRPL